MRPPETAMAGDALDRLVKLMRPKGVGDDRFVGLSHDLGFRQVFGGQVLGQALAAASQTVDPGWPVHSLHAYFLRPGDPDRPILYDVDRVRDGRRFATRRVVARHEKDPIFILAGSFQLTEQGLEHQLPCPSVPGPEGLQSDLERYRAVADRLPERVRALWTRERPIEIRLVDPPELFRPTRREPVKFAWIRAVHELPDDPLLQRALLAYASDFQLLGTALLPHGVTWLDPDLKVASLDHAMWFHRDARLDQWLLYAMDSPSASGARGLNRGSFFDRDGRLVATVAQEGLMRRRSSS
jgi:acyl-CoA thioesterase-2